MARPRLCRWIEQVPGAVFFKPCGVPFSADEAVRMSVESLEALRLSDIEGLTAGEAAERLKVSRHCYGRTLAEARRCAAEALVHGRVLIIGGGSWALHGGERKTDRRTRRNRNMTCITAAISSEGPALEDMVDPRYGRAGGFVLAAFPGGDLSAEPEISYLDNGDAQMLATGAGIATTEHLADAGVTAVISGYVGPKAFEALKAAGISVFQDMDGMSVGQALEKFRAGGCREAEAPNHEAGVQA